MQSGEVSVKQVLEFQVELFTFVPKGRSVKFLPCEGIGLRGITCTTAVSFAFRNGTAICCLRCSQLTFESALAIQYLFSEPKFKSQALQQSPQRALRQFIKAGGRKNML